MGFINCINVDGKFVDVRWYNGEVKLMGKDNNDTNLLFGGNDDAIQKTRQLVNVNQNNDSHVFVSQDTIQAADQEEENETQ